MIYDGIKIISNGLLFNQTGIPITVQGGMLVNSTIKVMNEISSLAGLHISSFGLSSNGYNMINEGLVISSGGMKITTGGMNVSKSVRISTGGLHVKDLMNKVTEVKGGIHIVGHTNISSLRVSGGLTVQNGGILLNGSIQAFDGIYGMLLFQF